MTGHRYPLEPLARVLGVDLHTIGGHQSGDLTGLHLLAEQLGISHRHARRLEQHGLTDIAADRYAIRAGHHPASIWPTWWADSISDEDEAGYFADDEPARAVA